MTTVIATTEGIYADTLCTYTVPFKTRKHTRIRDSVFAGAGDTDELMKYFDWIRDGGDQPSIDEGGIDVLEVSEEGIHIWGKKFVRLKVNEKVYAVGSGSQYAMGALAAGCTPKQAMAIAAKFDGGTGKQVEFVRFRKA